MKSATLTITPSLLLAPPRRARQVRVVVAPAPQAAGLFSRLERESAAGSRPETVVLALLALTGAAWPAYEALRLIAGF